MSTTTIFQREASLLRKLSGSTELEKTLRKAVSTLAKSGIPHLVGGGIAVQEHGYPRFTKDIDLIVPDAGVAREALLAGGFAQDSQSRLAVTDSSGVEVDILQGGQRPTGQERLPLPVPVRVSSEPQILPLAALIEAKLSVGRAQNFADVVQLIKANDLIREHPVDPAVKLDYEEAWDTAAAEQAAKAKNQPKTT